MAILLDTQVIILLEENPDRIPEKIRQIITSNAEIKISKVSVWEMAIKVKIGKLNLKESVQTIINNFQNGYNTEMLDIELSHIYQTQQLPLHHRDPFDRLLIAQSIVENIDIISSDAAFDAYNIRRIW